MAEHCPGLTSLDVAARRKRTDEALKAVAMYCPRLMSLNVAPCRKLTVEYNSTANNGKVRPKRVQVPWTCLRRPRGVR